MKKLLMAALALGTLGLTAACTGEEKDTDKAKDAAEEVVDDAAKKADDAAKEE